MKHLIRRFSRNSDSYKLLRSDSQSRLSTSHRSRRRDSFRAAILYAATRSARRAKPDVPSGHVPVYVGDQMERFVVSAELLSHPVLVALLEKSALEYGFQQEGVLRIPCQATVFERVMESVRLGLESCNDQCFFDE